MGKTRLSLDDLTIESFEIESSASAASFQGGATATNPSTDPIGGVTACDCSNTCDDGCATCVTN